MLAAAAPSTGNNNHLRLMMFERTVVVNVAQMSLLTQLEHGEGLFEFTLNVGLSLNPDQDLY